MPPVTTRTVAPTARAETSKTRSAPVALREMRRGRTSGVGRTGSWVATVVTWFFQDGPERLLTWRHHPRPGRSAGERLKPRAPIATGTTPWGERRANDNGRIGGGAPDRHPRAARDVPVSPDTAPRDTVRSPGARTVGACASPSSPTSSVRRPEA